MSLFRVISWILAAFFLIQCQSGRVNEKTEASYQGDKFQEHIRTTEARTPEQERLGFKLPQGFKIELFASEPDIGKPINIAFDAQGRLWVSQSFEYPFPAEPGKGSDRISVLEDTDGDGRADKFIHYEDTLNIPIGLLPLANQTFAYSIPNLYSFQDTDSDTQSDRSKVILGEFGHQDTHGMVNNLTRGYDGWVYTCHGFTNTSTIAGADGDSISMTSGNTFRFLPDGSRVEQTTFGQVNPFGLAFDEWGYLYSTDCHTSPIYQLIRGADYPHFGKKEVGIGFAPDTKPMGEESTALAGLVYYGATQFPEEYQQNFYIGDVVTCRIHRNSFRFEGSTPIAQAEEDLVKSDDPWFRPVDIKLGPDGALYVADFYNSVIGHYEVPLDHPKRDKIRGRIWRITYEENGNQPTPDLTEATASELIAAFEHPNQIVRMSALDQLTDRIEASAIGSLDQLVEESTTSPQSYVLALWALHRLAELDESKMEEAATHPSPEVRTHALRIIREMDNQTENYYAIVQAALGDESLHVQRAAVEALESYPSLETIELLMAQQPKIPAYDSHYQYTLRLILRNLLRDKLLMQKVLTQNWDQAQTNGLIDVITGVESEAAGLFSHKYLISQKESSPNLVRHAIRFVPATQIDEIVRLAHQQVNGDTEQGAAVFRAAQEGLSQRGEEAPAILRSWGSELAEQLFERYAPSEAVADSLSEQAAEKLAFAATLVGEYRLSTLTSQLRSSLQHPSAGTELKIAAAKSLLRINPEEAVSLIRHTLEDQSSSLDVKRNLIASLSDPNDAISVLEQRLNLPPELQREAATALATSARAREILFEKVRSGEIYARALVDPKVKEQLLLDISNKQLQAWEEITANIPAVDEERDQLIETRLAGFRQVDSGATSGVMVFNRNCKSCHQISNEGSMIGPQLTGIGNWGVEALATKILDPNRNISEAFRTYTIKTKDGQVRIGLYRREEGEVLIFANMTGEEFSVSKNSIAEQKASEYTLMPDHFGEQLSQEDFNALLSYLLGLQS